MSIIKEKSSFNIDSAKELINKRLFAPSVHCSYYGSFQFMKHTLKTIRNVTFEEIELDCVNYRGGTHGYIIDNTLSELRKKISNNREYAGIKRIIMDLKKFRIDSDYYNIQIVIDDAEKSLEYSEKIIHVIKSNLK